MDIREIQDFIDWYWQEIDGKPSREGSLTIAQYYLDDKQKDANICDCRYVKSCQGAGQPFCNKTKCGDYTSPN